MHARYVVLHIDIKLCPALRWCDVPHLFAWPYYIHSTSPTASGLTVSVRVRVSACLHACTPVQYASVYCDMFWWYLLTKGRPVTSRPENPPEEIKIKIYPPEKIKLRSILDVRKI